MTAVGDSVALLIRDRLAGWLGLTHAGQRDLYVQFGWYKLLRKEMLFSMYQRNGVASRIIRIYPQATWRDKPIIRDEKGDSPDPKKKNYSPFTEAVDELFEKHRVYHFIERADRIASIGQFGCLLLGLNDGQPLDKPLGTGKAPLLFLQPYSELNTTIQQIDDNPRSPRFGRPLYYTLQGGGTLGDGGMTTAKRSFRCHYTRVLHISELLDEDNVYGIPRLWPIYNYLQDLDKLLGSSAETFWLNARAGLSLEADKDASLTTEQLDRARSQALEYEHQLRRVLALQGMKVNQLNASVADPEMTISGLMDSIAGGAGIPKRILLGSERGELASSQDENNWAQRVQERRMHFGYPGVLRPIVDMLIQTQNLPEPQGQWWVEWGNRAMTPEQQAGVAVQVSTALKNYVSSPGADQILPPSEFRQQVLGLSPVPDTPSDDPFEDESEENERSTGGDEAGDKPQFAGEPFAAPAPPGASKPGDNKDGQTEPKPKVNAKVAPLYVYRPVINTEDIIAWARDQGFDKLLPAEQLHVTILYSKSNVDWMALGDGEPMQDEQGQLTVPPGGPRAISMFGEGAVVLEFASNRLAWRHEGMLRHGASSSYPNFCPHLTLTYDLGDLEIDDIEPYKGKIVLGPECFEEIDPDWQSTVKEQEL